MARRSTQLKLVYDGDADTVPGFGKGKRQDGRRAARQARFRKPDAQQGLVSPVEAYVRNVRPRSAGQSEYMQDIRTHDMVFGLGPAGTGKTYIAVTLGYEMLRGGKVKRMILSRPAVSAGEELGFLPGDMNQKMDPFMRPLWDVLVTCMSPQELKSRLSDGTIEIAPVGFLRGRTLVDAFIVLDEAQNATRTQLNMVVTRLGENSRMVITGDPDQSDLPEGTSGLTSIVGAVEGKGTGVAFSRLTSSDVTRHPLVRALIPLLST